MSNKLSIVIPIFNEKNYLVNFFDDLFTTFENTFVEYIIVNDGSNDGTEVWLRKYIKPLSNKKLSSKIKINKKDNKNFIYKIVSSKINFSKVIFIDKTKNFGKGKSVIDALKSSTGEYITILDADLEYDPLDSLNMYQLIKKRNIDHVIFGSRFTSDLPHRHKHILNYFINHVNTFLFNIFFHCAISDIHCGAKLFSRKVLQDINLTSNDFSIDLDIGSQIAKANYSISEVGVSYYSRTYLEGKKISWIDGILTYWYLFKFRFIQNSFKRNLIIFLSSFTGCLTGAHFGHSSGKILAILFGGFLGSLWGTKYSFGGILSIVIGLALGSQFGDGDGKTLAVLFGGLLGFMMAKKVDNLINRFNKKK